MRVALDRRAVGADPEAFPEESYPDDRPGRKPIAARKVLDAVLWVLNTGAQWHMLPQSYPNYKTVHRRFQQWCQSEVIRSALTKLRLAAEHADGLAPRNLGHMYAGGIGMPEDDVEAYKWYNLATAQGTEGARNSRDTAAKKMTKQQIAEGKRLSAEWQPKGN